MPITITNMPSNGPDNARKDELLDQACDVLHATGAKQRSQAGERVREVITEYKAAVETNKLSPNLKQAKDTLVKCAGLAETLVQSIDTALPAALPFGTATFNWADSKKRGENDPEVCELTDQWRGVSQQLKVLAKKTRARSKEWKPRGGRGLTIKSMTDGQPPRLLAMLCYDLFLEFRNETPTPTPPGKRATGKFSELVECVHELATGTEKIPASLTDAIKEVCKARGKRSNGPTD